MEFSSKYYLPVSFFLMNNSESFGDVNLTARITRHEKAAFSHGCVDPVVKWLDRFSASLHSLNATHECIKREY